MKVNLLCFSELLHIFWHVANLLYEAETQNEQVLCRWHANIASLSCFNSSALIWCSLGCGVVIPEILPPVASWDRGSNTGSHSRLCPPTFSGHASAGASRHVTTDEALRIETDAILEQCGIAGPPWTTSIEARSVVPRAPLLTMTIHSSVSSAWLPRSWEPPSKTGTGSSFRVMPQTARCSMGVTFKWYPKDSYEVDP